MWLTFVRVVLPRPVKVIRLVTRSTVEEIVLSRAHDKLNLTRAVIEGGKFSGKAALSHVIDSPSKVRSALVESNTKKCLSSYDHANSVIQEMANLFHSLFHFPSFHVNLSIY